MNKQDHGVFKTAIKQDSVRVGTLELKAYISAVGELYDVLNNYGELNPGWEKIRRLGVKIDRRYDQMNRSIVELASAARRGGQGEQS